MRADCWSETLLLGGGLAAVLYLVQLVKNTSMQCKHVTVSGNHVANYQWQPRVGALAFHLLLGLDVGSGQ